MQLRLCRRVRGVVCRSYMDSLHTDRGPHKDGAIMLIGILSDTHDQLDRTRTAVDRLVAAGRKFLSTAVT